MTGISIQDSTINIGIGQSSGLSIDSGSIGIGKNTGGFSSWIFASGIWADTGVWQDVREWSPAGLFMNGFYWWDTGTWQDAKAW